MPKIEINIIPSDEKKDTKNKSDDESDNDSDNESDNEDLMSNIKELLKQIDKELYQKNLILAETRNEIITIKKAYEMIDYEINKTTHNLNDLKYEINRLQDIIMKLNIYDKGINAELGITQ
jgi:chromosome segregation ATPase